MLASCLIVQNQSPQAVSNRHADYFKLKTVKAQKAQEETLAFPFTT